MPPIREASFSIYTRLSRELRQAVYDFCVILLYCKGIVRGNTVADIIAVSIEFPLRSQRILILVADI